MSAERSTNVCTGYVKLAMVTIRQESRISEPADDQSQCLYRSFNNHPPWNRPGSSSPQVRWSSGEAVIGEGDSGNFAPRKSLIRRRAVIARLQPGQMPRQAARCGLSFGQRRRLSACYRQNVDLCWRRLGGAELIACFDDSPSGTSTPPRVIMMPMKAANLWCRRLATGKPALKPSFGGIRRSCQMP